MKLLQFWVTLCLFSVAVLHLSETITVKFLNKKPLYVKLGRPLVLKAQFQLQPNEQIMLYTWERKKDNKEVRVAESNKPNNNRTFVEENGALLNITEVTNSDYGVYKVTVTAPDGTQVSDTREVLPITNPPAAFLAMQCRVPTQGTQWDSPRFSWEVDGVSVTNETAELSDDGSTLLLKKGGRNYTCITESSQGTSKVDFHIGEPSPTPTPEPAPCSRNDCTSWISIAVIFIVSVVLGVSVLIWSFCSRRPASTNHRGETSIPLNQIH